MKLIKVSNKLEKAKTLQELSALHKYGTIYSIEKKIEKYYDDVIQMIVMPEYGFTLDRAINQCKRHDPQIIVVEGE